MDGFGKGIGLLKHHPHPFPKFCDIDLRIEDIDVVHEDIPFIRAPSMRSFKRFMHRSNVDFPHPDGPMKAVTCVFRNFHVDLEQGLYGP